MAFRVCLTNRFMQIIDIKFATNKEETHIKQSNNVVITSLVRALVAAKLTLVYSGG